MPLLTSCGGSVQAPAISPAPSSPPPASLAPLVNPTATISAGSSTVQQGSTVTVTWQTQNANAITLTENGQSIALTGNPLNSTGMGSTVDGISAAGLGYQQVAQNGNTVTPFALGNTLSPNLPEGYAAYTSAWDGGKMDKFAYYNGDLAMGYYDSTTTGMSTLWAYANQFALAVQWNWNLASLNPRNALSGDMLDMFQF